MIAIVAMDARVVNDDGSGGDDDDDDGNGDHSGCAW